MSIPASACVVCTQCARSAHAVRTQCPCSAHAVQILGLSDPVDVAQVNQEKGVSTNPVVHIFSTCFGVVNLHLFHPKLLCDPPPPQGIRQVGGWVGGSANLTPPPSPPPPSITKQRPAPRPPRPWPPPPADLQSHCHRHPQPLPLHFLRTQPHPRSRQRRSTSAQQHPVLCGCDIVLLRPRVR